MFLIRQKEIGDVFVLEIFLISKLIVERELKSEGEKEKMMEK